MVHFTDVKNSIKAFDKAFKDSEIDKVHDDFIESVKKAGKDEVDVPITVDVVQASIKKEEIRQGVHFMQAENKEELHNEMRLLGESFSKKDEIPLIVTVASSVWIKQGTAKDAENYKGLTNKDGKPKAGVKEGMIVATRCIDGRTSLSMFDIVRDGKKIKELKLKTYMPTSKFDKAKKSFELNFVDLFYQGFGGTMVDEVKDSLKKMDTELDGMNKKLMEKVKEEGKKIGKTEQEIKDELKKMIDEL